MSTQKAPLLHFRNEIVNPVDSPSSAIHYNICSGLWLNQDGSSVIRDLLEGSRTNFETIKTATREAIDQSEGSAVFDQIILTKSREGVDQSEVLQVKSYQTDITRSRESIDQLEGSNFDFGETLMTSTNEGLDKSEVS